MGEILDEAELRKQRAVRRVGIPNSVCVECGEDDPRCIELHHIAGQRFHGDLAPVCRNCHRKLSDAQWDHGEPISVPPSFLEVVGHYLLGLADMFRLVASTLAEFAKRLIAMAAPVEGSAQ